MSTYADLVPRVREILNEAAEGFWDNDEIYTYITDATMEAWRVLTVQGDNRYTKAAALGSSTPGTPPTTISATPWFPLPTDFHKILSVVDADGNKHPIPHWKVTDYAGTKYLAFRTAPTEDPTGIWYVALPGNRGIYVESGNTGVSVDVPESLEPWVIRRAAILGLMKQGYDTRDMANRAEKMLSAYMADISPAKGS